MINHVMVGTDDVGRAERFYNAVLGVLGAGAPFRNVSDSGHVRLFWRHEGNTFGVTQPIDDEPVSVANGSTIGFKCGSPEQVRAFHDVAVVNGGTSIEEAPGLRESNMGPVHLAYVRDPDGHKLCAIHRGR